MGDKDRRSATRIKDEELTLKLNIGDFDSMTHTLNISASGVYCKVEKELPLMSRVKVALMLPGKDITLDGVVVREHPVVIDGQTRHYDVAIFFENPSPKDIEIIQSYISKKSSRGS